MQVDDQVHKYRGNTDPTHGLPERVHVYGIKRRFQIRKCDMQRLLELYASSVERQRVNPDW